MCVNKVVLFQKRNEVMLAKRMKVDIAQYHHLVVVLIKERFSDGI